MRRQLRWVFVLLLLGGCAEEPSSVGAIDGSQGQALHLFLGDFQDGAEIDERMAEDLDGAGDFDGDGLEDVAAISGAFNGAAGDDTGRFRIFSGQFQPVSVEFEHDQAFARMAQVEGVGDVDGDGFDDVLVSSSLYDGGGVDDGRAWLFCGGSPPSSIPCWQHDGGEDGAGLADLGALGDVNADGFSDVGIGVPGWDGDSVDEGEVRVFLGSDTGLASAADWTWSCGESGCGGSKVHGVGDVNADGYSDLIVSAPNYDNGGSNRGGAWLFRGSAAGVETFSVWSDFSTSDYFEFGFDAAAAGDVNGDGRADVAVLRRGLGINTSGEVSLYLGSSLGLEALPSWGVTGVYNYTPLGAVAGTGDADGDGWPELIIGNPRDGNTGDIKLYQSSGSDQLTEAFFLSTLSYVDEFGQVVAALGDLDGDGLAEVGIGVRAAQAYQNLYAAGTARIHHANPAPLSANHGATWTGASANYHLGQGGPDAESGDLNGDGRDDLVIGSGTNDQLSAGGGSIAVHHATASGVPGTPDWEVLGVHGDGGLGGSFALGDIDADGYDDLVTGVPGYDGAGTDEGAAWVFMSGPAGLASAPDVVIVGASSGAELGSRVDVGDANCDGYADVAVSAPGTSDVAADAGAVYVAYGSATGLDGTWDWSFGESQAGGRFGVPVFGDMDGDGCDELLVGAPDYDVGPGDEGAVFLFAGGPTGLAGAWSWFVPGASAGVRLGEALEIADFDADGFGDVAIASPAVGGGNVAVYGGTATVPSSNPSSVVSSVSTGDLFGSALHAGGDVNGDGYPDMVVGSPGATEKAYVYCGGPNGLGTTPCAGELLGQMGLRVGIGGDYNADGFHDVVATRLPSVSANGEVRLYEGGSADHAPRTTRPLARQADGGAVLQTGALSQTDSFQVEWNDVAPAQGAARVRIEVEVSPAGTPFDGATVLTGPWVDSGETGADLDLLVEDLSPETGYHWRARIAYHPAQAPPVRWTRWLYGDSAMPQGVHFRTFPDSDGDGVIDSEDCEPDDAAVFPGNVEVCDGADQDCDTDVDEGFDGDGDGAFDGADAGCVAFYGASAVDCADADASAFPGATEVCDGDIEDCDGTADAGFDLDEDGAFDVASCAAIYGADADCDDTDPSIHPSAAEGCDGADSDCDGAPGAAEVDDDGDSVTECDGDCDDSDDSIHPSATEVCDSVDNDCDTDIDADDSDTDADSDTYSACTDDCDDTDPFVYSGAPELCGDLVDSDCDGSIADECDDFDGDGLPDLVDPDIDGDGDPGTSDCDEYNPAVHTNAIELCDDIDSDCDNSLVDGELDFDNDGDPDCTDDDDDGDGFDEGPDPTDDCDDLNPSLFPGAQEFCDGVDSDCDGSLSDEFDDLDGDGNPDCEDPDDDGDGYLDGDDCDPDDPDVNPDADEQCNGLDDDCDGAPDADEADGDGDGFRVCEGDCDDGNAATNPDGVETCNGVDDDCAGGIDDGLTFEDYYRDADGDVHGDLVTPHPSNPHCVQPPGYVTDATDCDDTDVDVHPEAPELCNGTDDDCDAEADEDLEFEDWYADSDGDGFGSELAPHPDNPLCAAPVGYVRDVRDCDDGSPGIHPDADEVTQNNVDENCDGVVEDPGGGQDVVVVAPGISCAIGTGASGGPILLIGVLLLGRRRRRGSLHARSEVA